MLLRVFFVVVTLVLVSLLGDSLVVGSFHLGRLDLGRQDFESALSTIWVRFAVLLFSSVVLFLLALLF